MDSKPTAEGSRSFEYWYEKFSPLVLSVLRRNGITPIEDAAQEVWAAFWSGRYPELFNPDFGSESNFMWHFTERRARGMRSKQGRTPSHGAFGLVNDGREAPGELTLDHLTALSVEVDMNHRLMLSAVRATLRNIPMQGKRDLARLFDLLLIGFDQKEISTIMGVAEGTVSHAMADLRKVIEIKTLLTE